MMRSSNTAAEPDAAGRTTRSRAESRGEAGRNAMRSGGRSKSKRSVRTNRHVGWVERSETHHPLRRIDNSTTGFGCAQHILHVPRDARPDDAVRIGYRLAALDPVYVFHPGRHFAPDSVLAVEPFRVLEADEELAVAGIRTLRPRHRHRAAHMFFIGEFGFELLARAAGAGAARTSGLRHKPVDHAMELQSVIEAVAHQFLDASDVVGRKVRPH